MTLVVRAPGRFEAERRYVYDVVLTERLGLGAAAHDPAGILAAIQSLLRCADTYRRASEGAWRYFHEHHRPEVVLPQIERIFLDAAGR